MKGLRQHIIDFEIIPTDNPNTLVFIDSSDYFTEPERPLLEITIPGFKDYFLVNIVARKVNTFNSNTIGLTKSFDNGSIVNLPDGAYSFRYKVCPYEYAFKDKTFFRTTLIENRLANIYVQLDKSDCNKAKDDLILRDIVEIHTLIEGAKLIANKNKVKAGEFYELASDLIDDVLKSLCNDC